MYSIILRVDLEIRLGMGADGADLRRGGAHHNVAAVPALPDLDLALLKDLLGLHVPEQGTVALFVVLLNLTNGAELGGQLGEALRLGGLGKALVHIRPLVVLPICGNSQVLSSGPDTLQFLEPHLGVLFFVVCGFQKQGGDLFEAFLLGLGGEIGVLVPSLGFSGESGLQILLGLRSGVFGHSKFLPLKFEKRAR